MVLSEPSQEAPHALCCACGLCSDPKGGRPDAGALCPWQHCPLGSAMSLTEQTSNGTYHSHLYVTGSHSPAFTGQLLLLNMGVVCRGFLSQHKVSIFSQ